MIGHKITVNHRQIRYDYPRRNHQPCESRRRRIRDCIDSIRRLRTNPTSKDKYWNPAINDDYADDA